MIDPKVRKVGFFAPPDRSNSGQPEPIPSPASAPGPVEISSSGNSLSPVMIPPARHPSDGRSAPSFAAHPASPLRRESVAAASSYNPSELFPPATSPSSFASSAAAGAGYGEFSEEVSPGRAVRGGLVRASVASSSFPGGGFDLTAVRASSVPASELTTVSVVNMPPGIAGKL